MVNCDRDSTCISSCSEEDESDVIEEDPIKTRELVVIFMDRREGTFTSCTYSTRLMSATCP